MPGRKKAVIIGINYAGTEADLHGPVNDALRWIKVLSQHYGFERKAILAMIDEYPRGELVSEDDESYSQPTKEGIMEALDWLVSDALEGDCLAFIFAGHGTQVLDSGSSDSNDKLEEAICPVDWDEFEWGIIPYKLITDEVLHQHFARLPSGVLLTVVIDACLAGNLLHVPLCVNLEYPEREVDNEPVTQAMYNRFTFNCNVWLNSQHLNALPRRLPCEPQRPLWARMMKLFARDEAPPLNEGLAVFCITAGHGSHTALEACFEGTQQGTLSYCLLQALESKQFSSSYLDLMEGATEVASAIRSEVMPYLDQYFQISYGKNAGPDECRVFDASSAVVAKDRARRRRGQRHRPD
ncbi:unnamed protein product [Polarella glacialis]|uniref:Peptidase C14 caspase domain-containing protein n=1 Tax=Polarella glacialis TaxID=89957 RepID=A0A813IIX6_POLGL|nr:unnamed protein product [Polarella glacialis]